MKKFIITLLFLTTPLFAEEILCTVVLPKNCNYTVVNNGVEGSISYSCLPGRDMFFVTDGLKKHFFSKIFELGRTSVFYLKIVFKRTSIEGNEISVKCE
jgi:hypothetical protein